MVCRSRVKTNPHTQNEAQTKIIEICSSLSALMPEKVVTYNNSNKDLVVL